MAGETKLKMAFKFKEPMDRVSHVEAKVRALVNEKMGVQKRKYKVVDIIIETEEDSISKATAMVVMLNQPDTLNE